MGRHDVGPRRSQSLDAYLRRTRVLTLVALLGLAGGIASDTLEGGFWARHALLAGLVASLIVVALSAAVLNEVLDRMRRQRWRVLAQYVMLELVRNARLIWTGVLERAGLLPDGARPEAVDEQAQIARDTPRLAAALRQVVADEARLRDLNEWIALLAAHSEEVLGRWAAVMLNADVYAEVIDRHVELASEVGWLNGLLDTANPPEDKRRHRRALASAAVQVEGGITGDSLADRVVAITQLAEELDRGTLELALKLVPLQWWENRLSFTLGEER